MIMGLDCTTWPIRTSNFKKLGTEGATCRSTRVVLEWSKQRDRITDDSILVEVQKRSNCCVTTGADEVLRKKNDFLTIKNIITARSCQLFARQIALLMQKCQYRCQYCICIERGKSTCFSQEVPDNHILSKIMIKSSHNVHPKNILAILRERVFIGPNVFDKKLYICQIVNFGIYVTKNVSRVTSEREKALSFALH